MVLFRRVIPVSYARRLGPVSGRYIRPIRRTDKNRIAVHLTSEGDEGRARYNGRRRPYRSCGRGKERVPLRSFIFVDPRGQRKVVHPKTLERSSERVNPR